MPFVKVTPLAGTEASEIGEFHLAIDRISSFNTGALELYRDQPITQIRTVYGTDFHIAGTPEEFALQIRGAIYNYTYFAPQ